MKRYRRLQLLAVAALLFQLVVGLSGELTSQREFFPFTSWFLFTLVPHRIAEYDLVLRSQGDRTLDPPLPYSHAAGYVNQPHSITVYQLIQKFGRAEEAHDDDGSRLLRRQVEAQFAQPGLRYDLVRVTYLPVERWETGRVRETRTLRSFEYDVP